MRQILILRDQAELRSRVETDLNGISHVLKEQVYSKVADRNGLFHGWTHVEKPKAIIELPSGDIALIPYDYVRFV